MPVEIARQKGKGIILENFARVDVESIEPNLSVAFNVHATPEIIRQVEPKISNDCNAGVTIQEINSTNLLVSIKNHGAIRLGEKATILVKRGNIGFNQVTFGVPAHPSITISRTEGFDSNHPYMSIGQPS